MAYTHGRLVSSGITTISDSVGAVVTNDSGETTYIRLIVIHNTNTTAETVLLHYVPDNAAAVGTAADANKIWEKSVTADETIYIEFPAQGIVMSDTNDTIQAVTDTASKVTIMAFGGTE